jgi:hypothetical protein
MNISKDEQLSWILVTNEQDQTPVTLEDEAEKDGSLAVGVGFGPVDDGTSRRYQG